MRFTRAHTHTRTHTLSKDRVLFSHVREENPGIVTTRTDLEDIVLSEIRQTEKDNYYFMVSLVCRTTKNKQQSNSQKQTVEK